jgi:hypothetical protein
MVTDGIVVVGGPDLDGAGSRHEEFHDVIDGGDPPMPTKGVATAWAT